MYYNYIAYYIIRSKINQIFSKVTNLILIATASTPVYWFLKLDQ